MILDGFAGPGGWDEGARIAGYEGPLVGIEWDKAACQTAVAAGHPRVRADVATYPTAPFVGKVTGLIMSPPCQAWSMAGKRDGEKDREQCHQLASMWATGEPSPFLEDEWADTRSQLVCEPIRWVRDIRPAWVALEQVPPVLGLWQHFARIYRHWGYSVWTGVLSAEAYGVPQTRKRAILIARRDGVTANPPAATHQTWPPMNEPDLFAEPLPEPVSMAEALGWHSTDLVGFPRRADTDDTIAIDGTEYRARDLRAASEPAQVVTEKARSWLRIDGQRVEWSLMTAGKTGEGRPREAASAPAATITGKGTAAWVVRTMQQTRQADGSTPRYERSVDRPATTVCADSRIGRPGHKDREGGESQFERDSYPITVQEAAVLQSFRADYPWQGSKTKQHEQVGNCIPPLLAAAILRPLLNVSIDSERD